MAKLRRYGWLLSGLVACNSGPISDFPFAGSDDATNTSAAPNSGFTADAGVFPTVSTADGSPASEGPARPGVVDAGTGGFNPGTLAGADAGSKSPGPQPGMSGGGAHDAGADSGSQDGSTPDAGSPDAGSPAAAAPDAASPPDPSVDAGCPQSLPPGPLGPTDHCAGAYCGRSLAQLQMDGQPGACRDDASALQASCSGALSAASAACAQDALARGSQASAGNIAACLAAMNVDLGKAACQRCYAEEAACALQVCSASFIAGSGASADQCRASLCAPRFALCSGLPGFGF
jgi:hypothetical protein